MGSYDGLRNQVRCERGTERVPRVVYVLREDIRESLAQSQVVKYLEPLAGDHEITVVCLKKDDSDPAVDISAAEFNTDPVKIIWGRFRRNITLAGRVGAGMLNLISLYSCVRSVVSRERVDLLHARSYIPAFICRIFSRRRGIPYIFDMRALWIEELLTTGRVRRGSFGHRLFSWLERVCLRDASGVVSLTAAGLKHLERSYGAELKNKPVLVIPTCADLDTFTAVESDLHEGAPIRIGCTGTVLSGWFRLEWLAALYQRVAAREPSATLEIVTRDQPDQVKAGLAQCGVADLNLAVYSASRSEMPQILRAQSANVMFYKGGAPSELGRSPTRMGEVLGCGRPVIANRGVGDLAEVIEEYRVGVLMESDSPTDIDRAIDALMTLLEDRELPLRCRHAAEAVFSLDAGIQRYRQLYSEMLG